MEILGEGIGGGVFADGALIRGRSCFAGEIGHMAVAARGAACHCGSHGCLERYASGGGLNRLTREAAIEVGSRRSSPNGATRPPCAPRTSRPPRPRTSTRPSC